MTAGAVLGNDLQLEAMHTMYSICNLNKRLGEAVLTVQEEL